MEFAAGPKQVRLRSEWELVHPDLRKLGEAWTRWSKAQGLPPPVATHLVRYTEEHVRIYITKWKALIAALKTDELRMAEGDRKLAITLVDKSEAQLRVLAERKFTWHVFGCAGDFRVIHYSGVELSRVRGWLGEQATQPLWEFLVHDVAGPHIHLGRRDREWQRKHAGGFNAPIC